MAHIKSMSCIEWRVLRGAAWLWIALALPFGCRRATPPEPRLERVQLTDAGLAIEFDRAAALARVDVLDEAGDLLQSSPAAPGRSAYHVPFRWTPDIEYRVILQLGPVTIGRTVRAPPQPPPLRAVVELPLGQQAWELGSTQRTGVLLLADGRIDVGLTIECRRQERTHYRLNVHLPVGVTQSSDDERLQVAGGVATLSGSLEIESDYVLVVAQLQAMADTFEAMLVEFEQWAEDVDGSAPNPAIRQSLSVDMRRADASELAALVRPGEAMFPVDATGQARPEQLADTVVLPNPVWSALRGWLRPADRMFNFYEPYALHSLELTNEADLPLNLLVQSDVVAAGDDEPLLDFAPPRWLAPRESPTADHLLRLAADETAPVTMPLYVRPAVRPGSYQRRLRVYLVGSDEPLAQITRPLEVVRGDPVVSVVVIAAVMVALAAWVFMAIRGRKLLSGLGTEGLTRVGMIGGLHFVVSYAARIGGDVIAGVTGPFYIFITGLANEGVACVLLAALVTLAPRVGVLTLSSLTVFLLNAMFTGQFGLVDLLFVTVSIVLGEAMLAVLGVTTGGTLRRPRRSAPFSAVLRVALAIGLANAATLYVQYCLIQVLHRLFFADWYVAAVAIVTGLIYGGLGAAAGTLVGYELRRTVR